MCSHWHWLRRTALEEGLEHMGLSAQSDIHVRFENGFGKLVMISESTSLICFSSHPIKTASSRASSQISFISIIFSFRTLIFSEHPTGEPFVSSQVGSKLSFLVGDSISRVSYSRPFRWCTFWLVRRANCMASWMHICFSARITGTSLSPCIFPISI